MNFRSANRVKREFAEVVGHYMECSLEAANRFVGEFELAMAEVRHHPTRHAYYLPEFFGPTYRSCRLSRFPYSVVYTVTDTEVLVLAIAHASREPGYWMKEK